VIAQQEHAQTARLMTPARLATLAVLIAGLIAFFALRLDRYVTLETLKTHRGALTAWVAAHRIEATAAYLALYIVTIGLSLPVATLMTITGGFLFGPYLGSVLAVAGATAGATAVFVAARFVIGDALRARAGPWLKRMEAGFNRNAFSYLLAIRLLPVFPFVIVNLVPAFLGVRLGTYVAATLIGIIPVTCALVLVGHGLGAVLDAGGKPTLDPWVLAALAGIGVLVLVSVAVRARRRRG
jgi:uncharacterized membrane protein YdjX (TVP38/TMEM64 family)